MLHRFSKLKSITTKFVILLVPAVTLATILFCVLVGYLTYQEKTAELKNKLDLLIQTHGGAIAEPLWNIDLGGAQSSVATVVLHPEIICAVVTQTTWSAPISWPNGCHEANDSQNFVSAPLLTRQQSVGMLTLHYTKEPIILAIKRDVLRSALLFALLLLVAASIAYSALRIIVHSPLDLLLRSIRASDAGENRSPVPWSSEDELGTVVGAYNDMIHQVDHNTAELIRAREQAEKADAGKTRFLANMSHELRTPLNAVIGITEMMRDLAVKKNENIEPFERVTRAGRHLLRLIDNILDFSKIDANRIELISEEVATQTFLYDIRGTALELVRQNNNEFILECGQLPATIRIDVLRLTQILINLIGNASKFTSNGSVELHVNNVTEENNVTEQVVESNLSGESPDNVIEFRVTDTGIGMTAEQTDLLFGDFSEIDQSVRRKYGGTGLGLAISQRLCQMMDSKIVVSSEPDAGSTFSFQLPV